MSAFVVLFVGGIKNCLFMIFNKILDEYLFLLNAIEDSRPKGAYDDEEAAARAYDLAALKYWGPGTLINFPVTDYSRDLEEMQNVSREDYLASLRRKSGGFSRGISKYRPLSSRWDLQFGRVPGADYFNSLHYGDNATVDNEYIDGFCMDRKIDLSSYIKWWVGNKARQTDSHVKMSEEAKVGCPEDIDNELRASELSIQQTEPYEMPRLGVFQGKKNHKSSTLSAMSILSQSAAYKSLQEKVAKKKEKVENDENENKSTINRVDRGKMIEKSSPDSGSEKLGAAFLNAGGLSINRNLHPLTPLLSAPLLTNYNSIDPLTDPVLWTSLVPNFHTAHLSIRVVYEFIIHPIEFSTCSSASSMVVVLIFAVELNFVLARPGSGLTIITPCG
ncbi:AP2-like ethylene-responsive transcription factor [Capsicum baccatum]|uniref:AP2-like ethylene-responsive transcription factor n=1 Tax=Capsicum baccatum TaxID=33114 RepID=A0A2G2XBB6_CAPBA|nr:AP2-like ethylene-responsive transcription factor [Capsicum baccatum]